jgi:hypothetical protein
VGSISEKPVSPDTRLSIKKCAKSAGQLLGIEPRSSTPSIIASTIDEFVIRWQKGNRPADSVLSPEDAPLIIGSLWGEALVSRFKWDWAMLTFHDYNDALAPAVVAADRSLVIYPLDYLHGCFVDPGIEVAVLKAYNLLKAGSTSEAQAGDFCNLMDAF